MDDFTVKITTELLQKLSELRAEPKFYARNLYPGAPNEDIRANSEKAVNAMFDRLLLDLRKSSRKSFVLLQFEEMLKCFETDDTEEREEACGYCEQVMALLGIESSDGFLNKWLYGFNPDDAD